MFCCAVSLSGRPFTTDTGLVTSRLRAHHPGDAAGSDEGPSWFATQTLLHGTPESRREEVPARDPAGRLMVSWLRLDNRDALGSALGWDAQRVTAATDPQLVMAAYERWGEECPDRLEGDFAFAVLDPHRHTLFGARDASGIRPFYYARTDHLFAVATTPALLLPFAADGVDDSVRPEWVARYLHGQSMTWDETPFPGIAKLPPGHSVAVDGDGVRVRRWHEYRNDPPWETTRADHWLADYRERLHEAVRCRIRSEGPIGVETSGGIDSSTVLALIATLAPERLPDLHGFAHVHAELEPEFVLETSRVHQVPTTHVFTRMEGDRRRGWETLGHPVEHANAVSYVGFYDMARTFGVRSLHSGHGGDELVTNSGHLALTELADRGAVGALLRDLPHASYKRPAWVARDRWRRRGGRTQTEASPLTEPMMGRLGFTPLTDRALREAGVAELTREAARYAAPYRRVNDFALQGRLRPFVSTRTSECSVVAASFAVDYRWPLLDRRLVQQWLSTPAVWKYAQGTGRYLHRRAISDVVPAKVAWKPTKRMFVTEPDLRAAPPHEPVRLHPLLEEIVDPERWQRPAHREHGRAPASFHDYRPWQKALDLDDWLRGGASGSAVRP